MLRLLAAEDPLPSLRLMAGAGVLAAVMDGPVALARLARLLRRAPDADPLLRLAALVRPPPAEPGTAARVAERWRLSREAATRLLALAQDPLPPLDASPAERRRAIYRLGNARYADLARLAAAEAGADGAGLAETLRATQTWEPPRLPVSGADVMAAGVPQGPRVGEILAAVEAWWQEDDFAPDRSACLARVRELAGKDA